MLKIIITGGSGLLGSNIAYVINQKFDVYSIYRKNKVAINNVHFLRADLSDRDTVFALDKIMPDCIIHCAALTDVDYCEKNPFEAEQQNVLISEYIAELAKRTGAYLIHISTDNVFNGKKGNYKESCKANPVNIYGKTKLEAERKVLSIYEDTCVVRTNIYGWNKLNKYSLAEWMVDKFRNNNEFQGLKDAFFSPILVNHLTFFLLRLWEKRYRGIIHVAGRQSCSKLDFAYKIAKIFGFGKNLVKAASLSDIKLIAPRGKKMSLNVSKAESILMENMPTVEEGLYEFKRLAEQGYPAKLKKG